MKKRKSSCTDSGFDILRIQKIKSKEGIKIKLRTQITRITQIFIFYTSDNQSLSDLLFT